MPEKVIMPRGTAAWLIKHTKLNDRQIAEFCSISLREIMDMKSEKIKICPVDPVNYTTQLTEEEIERCSKDSTQSLKIKEDPFFIGSSLDVKKKIGEKPYIPAKVRRNKKAGIVAIMHTYPMIVDKDLRKLMNTEEKTIKSIRENLEELAKNLGEINIEPYVTMNPFWKAIKEKYKIK